VRVQVSYTQIAIQELHFAYFNLCIFGQHTGRQNILTATNYSS
jgi:hypothetical protein